MAKTLTLTHGDKEYTLEFTRKTVAQMERNGFIAGDIDDKPMTCLPALFAGAFLAHHPWVKKDVIDEIYDNLPRKNELIGKLAEMYNEPIMSLLDEPDPEREGNADWAANW